MSISRRSASSAPTSSCSTFPLVATTCGPLRSATAFRRQPQDPPSLICPEDRSWFVGVPIYANEIAVAWTRVLVNAILTDQRLNAHPATPDEVLDIDD